MLTFIAYVTLQVKFITDPTYELHYTPNKKKSFCAYILKHVSIPGNVDGGHWWKTGVDDSSDDDNDDGDQSDGDNTILNVGKRYAV